MKGWLESFGVALCGLATSILVALADVAIARLTGFDLFTLSVWLVLPAGALFTGFAAASGYYFGSLYFHQRANGWLLVQMMLIAGLTQILIYWLGYATLVLDDGRKVSDLTPFAHYLDLVLTQAHYRIGHGRLDTGEVGTMGYAIAVAQFLGFLMGGVVIFIKLKDKAVCAACKLYLRPMAKRQKVFAGEALGRDYYSRLFTLPVDGPDFAALIRAEAKVAKVAPGAWQVDTALLGCPACKAQMIEEQVKSFNGKEWENRGRLARRVDLPAGVDLGPVFRG